MIVREVLSENPARSDRPSHPRSLTRSTVSSDAKATDHAVQVLQPNGSINTKRRMSWRAGLTLERCIRGIPRTPKRNSQKISSHPADTPQLILPHVQTEPDFPGRSDPELETEGNLQGTSICSTAQCYCVEFCNRIECHFLSSYVR